MAESHLEEGDLVPLSIKIDRSAAGSNLCMYLYVHDILVMAAQKGRYHSVWWGPKTGNWIRHLKSLRDRRLTKHFSFCVWQDCQRGLFSIWLKVTQKLQIATETSSPLGVTAAAWYLYISINSVPVPAVRVWSDLQRSTAMFCSAHITLQNHC